MCWRGGVGEGGLSVIVRRGFRYFRFVLCLFSYFFAPRTFDGFVGLTIGVRLLGARSNIPYGRCTGE